MGSQANTVLLDGATGTLIMAAGMPAGVCPELWASEHPDAVRDVLSSYISAGSQRALTFTFGANAIKLKYYGLEDRCEQLNEALASMAKSQCANVLLGGDIGPTGSFLAPMGDLGFESAVAAYRRQITGLVQGGVDYLAVETMLDIGEARAALIAAKDVCSLPVFVSMTFEKGKTLTGTDPVTALITLQSLGAAAVGVNCGAGPEEMLPLLSSMAPYAQVPLIAKPNAGMPVVKNGVATYPLGPEEFAEKTLELARYASYVGGCCGTTPQHISALKAKLQGLCFIRRTPEKKAMLSSPRRYVEFTDLRAVASLYIHKDETKKQSPVEADLWDSVKNGDYDVACEVISDLTDCNGFCLCVNGLPEVPALEGLTAALSQTFPHPICLRPFSAPAAEAALRVYHGRALIIMDMCADQPMRDEVRAVAQKYGALIVG